MAHREIDRESARLQALHRYEALDTEPEEAFDRITRLAKTVLQMPIVLVSLVDQHRQWFKSRQGLAAKETPRDVSFCTHAIEGDCTFIVRDARADPRFAHSPLVLQEPYVRYYVGVPLRTRDSHNVGTLCAMDSAVRDLTAEQVCILEDLARLVVDELELRLLATVDSLTGTMTRRSFYQRAQTDVERSKRYRTPLSCAIVDIDNFKQINDSHGHAAGDLLLQHVAMTCKSNLRTTDYVGRVGGDEFALMLPDTALVNAFDAAERLRRKIESTTIAVSGKPIQASISVGIAEFIQPARMLDELLKDADTALYDAKLEGRNRVSCYLDDLKFVSPQTMEPLSASSFGHDAHGGPA